jgi:catechol 2,3-dioxygenase-like lactoylglutathione lyase family enzyme
MTAARSSSIRGFHTIVLQVSDLEGSIAFYRDHLGIEFEKQSDRSYLAQLGATALMLHTTYDPRLERQSRGAGVHINLEVEDADALHESLRRQGLEPSDPTDRPWGRQFVLTDPDGYCIELLEPRSS